MSESIGFEELLDSPRVQIFRQLGKHIRNRIRLLGSLFVFGFVLGYPIAGTAVSFLVKQEHLVPDGTSIIIVNPLELVILRLQIAGYVGLGLVFLALICDAAAWRKKIDIPDDVEIPEISQPARFRILISIILSIILATIGILYSWEILLPFLLDYLHQDASSAGLEETWHLQAWVGFVVSLTLGSAFAFQVPLVVILLLRGGLVERGVLSKYRRHIWFVSVVIGAMLSPPDPLSLALLAGPMIMLFEVALLVDAIIPWRG